MLRICFNRKNKTLRAAWLLKEVMAMITRNYAVWASMNNIPLEEGFVDDAGAAGDEDMDLDDNIFGEGEDEEFTGFDMNVDEQADDDTPAFFKEQAASAQANAPAVVKTPSRRKKTKTEELVRGKVLKVLESTGLGEKRARQCDENDFLRLLSAVSASRGCKMRRG